MTPKEKAKELFMRNFEITVDDYCSKQCALIAVDEILKHEEYIIDKIKYSFAINGINVITKAVYWQQVKQEIKNL